MKKVIILTIIGLFFLISTAYALSPLTNGNFESGSLNPPTPISAYYSGTTNPIIDSNGYGSSGYCVKLHVSSGDTKGIRFSNVALSNGELTSITVQAHVDAGWTLGALYYAIYDNTDTCVRNGNFGHINDDGSTTFRKYTISVNGAGLSGTYKIDFYPSYYAGLSGTHYVYVDEIRLNDMPFTQYTINGSVIDLYNNVAIPNITMTLENTNGNVLSTFNQLTNNYTISATSLANGNYQLRANKSNYYDSVVTFNKPSAFSSIGSDYIYTQNITLAPAKVRGYLTVRDVYNLSTLKPVTFTIKNRDLGNYTEVITSNIGILDYNYSKGQYYYVTASVSGYNNEITYVITNSEFNNDLYLTPISVSQLNKYNVYGYVSASDYQTHLGNALVCLYNPSGTLINSIYTDYNGYYILPIPYTSYNTFGTYTVTGSCSGYINRSYYQEFDAQHFMSADYYVSNDIYLTPSNTEIGKGSFTIHVYDDDGASLLSNVDIKVYNFTTQTISGSGYTVNGYLLVPNLEPGYYTLVFNYLDYNTGYIYKQQIIADTATDITLMLTHVTNNYPTITPRPTVTPSGNPTGTPSGNPTGTPSNNPTVTPYPDIGQSISVDLGNMLTSWGITPQYHGVVLGLIIIIVMGLIPIAAAQYTNNTTVNNYVVQATVLFAIMGFIFDCVIGFFPIWILVLFAIIGGVFVVLSKMNSGG